MSPLLREVALLIAQASSSSSTGGGRWVQPPQGSLRRGLVWLRSPRVVVALAIAMVVAVLAVALARRWKRR